MKVSQLVLALTAVAGFAAATNAHAAAGTVTFQGEIVESACSVTDDTKDQTVLLGKWPTTTFAAVGDTSGAKAFQIKLEKCDAGNYTLRFDGNYPSGHPELLAVTGGATGVGIEILDNNGNTFPLAQDVDSNEAIIVVDDSGSATADLKARYKSYEETVTAGEADSTANFSIEYR